MESNIASCNETETGSSNTERTLVRRTPLPAGQVAILLYLRFCESASTSVIFPFLDELLASVTGHEEKVGYYAGVMEFTRQALSLVTVMFWSRLSDHIGRKPILLLGTVALAVSMISFGLSTIFWALVLSRCIFTGFNSNAGLSLSSSSFLPGTLVTRSGAGVIKGMIGEITNESNSADAFALLHIPWASGYAFGALIGGWLANPHKHFPSIFHAQIWIDRPYFLPCLTVACFTILGCLIIVLYLKETVPVFVRDKLLRRLLHEDDASQPLLLPTTEIDKPPPLASLLTPPILLACTNYCILGGLHASSNTLQPLFLAMPVHVGGLGLSSRSIGYIMAMYGLINAFVQTFLLGRLVRRYGAKGVFVSAMVTILPVFILPPAMNWCLRTYGWDNAWWGWLVKGMLAIQVACGLVVELGYGSIYMFINASAPNRRSLGAVNGVGQTLVSVGRIFIPALATSLFSFSIEHEILGGFGYLAYAILLVITFSGISIALRLPRIGESSALR